MTRETKALTRKIKVFNGAAAAVALLIVLLFAVIFLQWRPIDRAIISDYVYSIHVVYGGRLREGWLGDVTHKINAEELICHLESTRMRRGRWLGGNDRQGWSWTIIINQRNGRTRTFILSDNSHVFFERGLGVRYYTVRERDAHEIRAMIERMVAEYGR